MLPINLLSVDVEDYFQVSAFEQVSPPSSWNSRELRVKTNTERILNILKSYNVFATFFILGWVAERCPELVARIAAEGHEVASHGYGHQRIVTLSRIEFRDDIRRSKAILEDIIGKPVFGYRAPSYSISPRTPWAFDELLEAGYQYDSSIFPVRHDFYGIPDWPRFAGTVVKGNDGYWQPGEAKDIGRSFFEVPITTLRLAGKNLPIAGGGYFRLLPYAITQWGLKRINQKEGHPFVFYLHPWELDPDQPRIAGTSWKSRFRHYLNLSKTEGRFRLLLKDFRFGTISDGLRI